MQVRLILTIWLLMTALAGAQTHIRFDAGSFNANPATNRVVEFTPRQPFLGNPIEKTTDISGVCYLSNALPVDYSFTIRQKGSAKPISGQLTVTATNLGVVDADEITSVAGVQTYPSTGKSAWSIQASDARYLKLTDTNGLGGGGANVTATGIAIPSTNGSTVTVDVPATNVVAIAQQQLASGSNTFSGAATLSALTAASPLSVNFLGGTLTSGGSTMGASGFSTAGGTLNPSGFFGNATGLSNIPPAQVAAIMATNSGIQVPQHINAGILTTVAQTSRSNQTVRIFNIGDDQVQPVNGLIATLSNSYPLRVSGYAWGGSFVYLTAAGTYNLISSTAASSAGLWPSTTVCMGNGSSFTNASTTVSGWPTTRVGLNYYQSNGFGSILIRTQAFGGTIGNLATVSANNSGSLGFAYTNFVVPYLTNMVVSVYSTGTNIVVSASQTDTNSGARYSLDDAETGNISLKQYAELNTVASNATRIFFASNRYDLIIVHDISGTSQPTASNEWWTAQSAFENALASAGITTEVVYWTPTPLIPPNDTNSLVLAQRDGMIAASKYWNRRMFDAYNVLNFPAGYKGTTNWWLTADGLHLNQEGSDYVTGYFLRDFGLTPDTISLFKPTVKTATDISGKANLSGGNTFSGAQVVSSGDVTMQSGTFDVTGEMVTRGSGGAATFIGRSGTGNMKIYSPSSGTLVFRDATDAADLFAFTNASGTRYLHPITANVPMNLGRNEANKWWWNIWVSNVVATSFTGNGASLTNLLFKTNYVAAEFAPTSGYIKFVGSNNALYAVSATKTNLISAP